MQFQVIFRSKVRVNKKRMQNQEQTLAQHKITMAIRMLHAADKYLQFISVH
jgi:hypothetical protein